MNFFSKREIGNSGESAAAKYLSRSGYSIIERNYFCRFGEIDIIAEDGKYICFIEVKSRRPGSLVTGAEAVDLHKRRKIIMTAKNYLMQNSTELQPRFDVIEVGLRSDGRPIKGSINHIINAFSE